MTWNTGRRLGRFEENYQMLETKVEEYRTEAAGRSDKLDERLNSVDSSTRKIENAVWGLPAALAEIKDSLHHVNVRIDEVLQRQKQR